MRLCRKCAFPVGFFTLGCGRCGMRLPYLRSGGPRRQLRLPRWMAVGRGCPHCGIPSRRRRTPLLLRPLKAVAGERFSYRACDRCGWSGPSLHGPLEPTLAVGQPFTEVGGVVREPRLRARAKGQPGAAPPEHARS